MTPRTITGAHRIYVLPKERNKSEYVDYCAQSTTLVEALTKDSLVEHLIIKCSDPWGFVFPEQLVRQTEREKPLRITLLLTEHVDVVRGNLPRWEEFIARARAEGKLKGQVYKSGWQDCVVPRGVYVPSGLMTRIACRDKGKYASNFPDPTGGSKQEDNFTYRFLTDASLATDSTAEELAQIRAYFGVDLSHPFKPIRKIKNGIVTNTQADMWVYEFLYARQVVEAHGAASGMYMNTLYWLNASEANVTDFWEVAETTEDTARKLEGKLDKPTSGKYILDKDIQSQIGELMKVGGRNLITAESCANRTSDDECRWLLEAGMADSIVLCRQRDFPTLKAGEEVTLSILIQCDKSDWGGYEWAIRISDVQGSRKYLNPNNVTQDGFCLHKWTFTIREEGRTPMIQLYNHRWNKDESGNIRFNKRIEAKQIKLERGNVATDWTPAPEDLLAELNEYTTLKQYKNDRAEDSRKLDNKLDKPTSGKYVLDTDIPSQFEELMKASKTEWRNLLISDEEHTTEEEIATTDYQYRKLLLSRKHTFVIGDYYTLSMDVQVPNDAKGLDSYNIFDWNGRVNKYGGRGDTFTIHNGRNHITFKWGEAGNELSNTGLLLYRNFGYSENPNTAKYTIKTANFTLVKGKEGMETYTPAPEDMLAELSKYMTLKKYNENREEDSRKLEGKLDKPKTGSYVLDAEMPDRIKEKIKGDTELQGLLKGEPGHNPDPSDVADLIANSKTYRDRITDGLPDEERVKELARTLDEERKVGGRNLIKDSKNTLSNGNYFVGKYDIADPSQMVAGEEYTIQIWGTIDGGDYSETLWVYNSGGTTNVASIPKITNGVWKQTFKWRDDPNKRNSSLFLYRAANHPDDNKSSNTTITKIKLERGNVATDWTPAPEDLFGALDSAKLELTQTITDGLKSKADTSALDSAKLELTQTITDGLKSKADTSALDSAKLELTQTITDGLKSKADTSAVEGLSNYVLESHRDISHEFQLLRAKDKELEAKQMQDDERKWLRGVMRKLIPSDIDPDAFANGKFVSMSSDLSLRSSNGSPTAILGGSSNKKKALLLAGVSGYGTNNQTEQTAIYEDGSAKFGEVTIVDDRIELKGKKGEPLALTADDAVFVKDVVRLGKVDEDSLSISTKAITNSSSGVKLGDFVVANDGTKVTISIGELTSEVYAVSKSMLLMLDVEVLGSWSGESKLVDTGGGAFGKPNFSIEKTPLVAQNLTWERYLDKGSHTLLAIIYSGNNTDKGSIKALNVHQSYDASKMQTLISRSGVRAYGDGTRYFDADARTIVKLANGNVIQNYYVARVKGGMRVDSLTLEQPLDAPGCVLAGGSVDWQGKVLRSFGKYKNESGKQSPSAYYNSSRKVFVVNHSIGNTNYVPMITATAGSWADLPQVVAVNSYSFDVAFINYNNDRGQWGFNYTCFKAD